MIKDDSVFLRHILDEINFLEESSLNIAFSDLMKNKEKQRAWLRSLEVIGEATKNLWLLAVLCVGTRRGHLT